MRWLLMVSSIWLIPTGTFSQANWPPDYADRRFKEEWYLADRTDKELKSRNWSDQIKSIALGPSSKFWLSVGGQLRVRYMGTINENFLPQNSGLFTIRSRLFGDMHFGRRIRLYSEGIYSNTTDDARNRVGLGSPVTNGALLNLFAEAKIGNLERTFVELWLGRRELQWGHERMISPGNWLNSRRSWDGAGASLRSNELSINAFVSRPVVVVPDGYSKRDEETSLWGVRVQTRPIEYNVLSGFGVESWSSHTKLVVEPYFLQSSRKDMQFEQGIEDEERSTYGILIAGPVFRSPFDFEVESMYQNGSFGEARINAFSITAEFGYAPRQVYWSPHVWVGYDYSSGDRNLNDDQLGTFDPLYPQVSTWFGEHGLIDRKNLQAFSANLDILPWSDLMIRFTYWNFSRASDQDAVYDTSNGIFRSGTESSSRELGNSFQFSGTFEPHHQWQFTATYNFWKPGRFFAETQQEEARTQHFIMITSQYNF